MSDKTNHYNHASQVGEQLIWKFIEEVRKDRKMIIPVLCEKVGISPVTYNRYKKQETHIELPMLLSILSALDVRPYFVPKEMDANDTEDFENRMFFN